MFVIDLPLKQVMHAPKGYGNCSLLVAGGGRDDVGFSVADSDYPGPNIQGKAVPNMVSHSYVGILFIL